MAFKQITSSFSAAPQLTQDDVAAAAQAGYRSIISNRPDGEEAGQPSAEDNGPNGRANTAWRSRMSRSYRARRLTPMRIA